MHTARTNTDSYTCILHAPTNYINCLDVQEKGYLLTKKNPIIKSEIYGMTTVY